MQLHVTVSYFVVCQTDPADLYSEFTSIIFDSIKITHLSPLSVAKGHDVFRKLRDKTAKKAVNGGYDNCWTFLSKHKSFALRVCAPHMHSFML